MKARRQALAVLVLAVLWACAALAALPASAVASAGDEGIPEESGGFSPADDARDPFSEKGAHFAFAGQYKHLLTFRRVDDYRGDNPLASQRKNLIADLNRVRLSPEFRYADILTIHVDWDNDLMLSSYNRSYEFDAYWRGSEYNEFFDLTWEPHYGKDLYYRTRIHRAYAKLSLGHFTFPLGRQQIRFGSGRMWNPLDILNPVSPTFVEGADDQKGTDAFRMDYYINEVTELTLVSNQKKCNDRYDDMTIEDSNTVLRLTVTIHETELSVLAAWISRRAVAGIDVTSSLGDGMVRGSVLYSYPRNDGRWYFQASAGYEFTFSEGVYFVGEYFFNQNGVNFNPGLEAAYVDSLVNGVNQGNYLYLANQFLTMNQHYAGIALGYDFMPLLRGDFFIMVDFQGYGLFFTPSLKYSARENLDIHGGIMFGFVFDGAPKSSDFEAFDAPFMYYAGLTWYF
jgi:hypothetical protein